MYAVKFTAEWCGPCQRLDPVLAALVDAYDFEIYEVDIDDENVAQELVDYRIQGVPTMIFFDENDEPVKRLVGAQRAPIILEAFNE